MISAKVLADSVSEGGARLTTMEVVFNRYVLSEWNTHRAFSRNAASSRAIPVRKMLYHALFNTAYPVHWGENCPGMSAKQPLNWLKTRLAQWVWFFACLSACFFTVILLLLRVHKQVANRLLEPFLHVTVIVTATDWENFFSLRTDEGAQPEMRTLAMSMLDAYMQSEPRLVKKGEWHMPFTDNLQQMWAGDLLKISVARCARLSYLNHDGKIDHRKDIALHDRLLKDGHMSPFEHQATPCGPEERWGNFKGWVQYRKTVPGENRKCDLRGLHAKNHLG